MVENRNTHDPENAGRDHHPFAYSMFLAGGGIKGGQVIGQNGRPRVQHFWRTRCTSMTSRPPLLHCLGLDHTRLTYRYMGRDFRLTDVAGNLVKKMLV